MTSPLARIEAHPQEAKRLIGINYEQFLVLVDLRKLGLQLEEANPQAWRRGGGCSNCFNSGYLGREAIVELLNVDDTVRQLIYEGTMPELHRYLDQINFESFRLAAIEKVTKGVTTLTEVLRVLPHSALVRKS